LCGVSTARTGAGRDVHLHDLRDIKPSAVKYGESLSGNVTHICLDAAARGTHLGGWVVVDAEVRWKWAVASGRQSCLRASAGLEAVRGTVALVQAWEESGILRCTGVVEQAIGTRGGADGF